MSMSIYTPYSRANPTHHPHDLFGRKPTVSTLSPNPSFMLIPPLISPDCCWLQNITDDWPCHHHTTTTAHLWLCCVFFIAAAVVRGSPTTVASSMLTTTLWWLALTSIHGCEVGGFTWYVITHTLCTKECQYSLGWHRHDGQQPTNMQCYCCLPFNCSEKWLARIRGRGMRVPSGACGAKWCPSRHEWGQHIPIQCLTE